MVTRGSVLLLFLLVLLLPVSSSARPLFDPITLVNPGFEVSGTGWTLESGGSVGWLYADPPDVYEGSYSVWVRSGTVGVYKGLCQTVTNMGVGTYALAAFQHRRTSAGSTAKGQIAVNDVTANFNISSSDDVWYDRGVSKHISDGSNVTFCVRGESASVIWDDIEASFTPDATPTPTDTPTPTVNTPTTVPPTATNTPVNTPTPVPPTATNTPGPTLTPTNTPTSTPTPEVIVTATPSPTPTISNIDIIAVLHEQSQVNVFYGTAIIGLFVLLLLIVRSR